MKFIDVFDDIFHAAVGYFRPPIGAFNELIFEVSTAKVLTYDDYRRESKARYARHELINQATVLEKLGRDLEEISFKMTFTRSLGVNPAAEAAKVRQLCLNGVADFFILGNNVIGENLWVIESVSEAAKSWNHSGGILVSSVDVKMIEYVPAVI